jgi:hypothetical protein
MPCANALWMADVTSKGDRPAPASSRYGLATALFSPGDALCAPGCHYLTWKSPCKGPEKPFDLAPAPSGIRSGVDELDFEIGADHLQMGAGKDLAVIGVELPG